MSISTHVTQTLDAAGVPYQLRMHSRSVFTTEEAARERGVRLKQIVKVMIAVTSAGRPVALLIPGDKKLKLKFAARALGQSNMTLAPPEIVESVTGLTIGAISPIGIHVHMDVLYDRGILEEETVAISSGSPDAGVVLRSSDLIRLIDATPGVFT